MMENPLKVDLDKLPCERKLGWDFTSWNQEYNYTHSTYRCNTYAGSLRSQLKKLMSNQGFAVLQFDPALLLDDLSPFRVTALLSVFGNPIRVFNNEPAHWRVLDVNLRRPRDRSRGEGKQPLHMDFVNAEWPPDFVCLLCVREDPLGGGHSLVANFVGVANEVSDEALHVLRNTTFVDGKVVNLSNVGVDVNPFHVFPDSGNVPFRYTTRLSCTSNPRYISNALDELDFALRRRTKKFQLRSGQLLVIDQTKALHGREAVGKGQASIPPTHRRLVLHSFASRN